MKRDAIDQRIIALLNEDARRSNRNIGRTLELSEGAVRQRIRKLEDNKVITLGVVTDKRASGLMCSAYVRVKTSPRHTRAVAKAIAGHETVQFVGLSFGAYDIIAYVLGKDRDTLVDLTDTFASLEGVVSIDVREPVEFVKHRQNLISLV